MRESLWATRIAALPDSQPVARCYQKLWGRADDDPMQEKEYSGGLAGNSNDAVLRRERRQLSIRCQGRVQPF